MSDFSEECAVPQNKAPRHKLVLTWQGDGTCEYELSSKAYYTVGGEGKDIQLPVEFAKGVDAVIYHTAKGGTFIYDCGGDPGIFRPKSERCLSARTGYLWEVNSRLFFGDCKDKRTVKGKLQDASAKPSEQKKPKAQARIDASDAAESTVKRPLGADEEKGTSDSPGADATSSAEDAMKDLEATFSKFSNHISRDTVVDDTPVSKGKDDDSEPPQKKQRTELGSSSSSSAAAEPAAAKKPSLQAPVLGPKGYTSSLPRAKLSAAPEKSDEDQAAEKRLKSPNVSNGNSTVSARSTVNGSSISKPFTASNGSSAIRPASEQRAAATVSAPVRSEAAVHYGPAPPTASQRLENQRIAERTRGRADMQQPRQVSITKPAVKSNGKCDKCDGPHPTASCPHFRKGRENHKDAWANYGKEHPGRMGSAGGNFVLRNARVVPQPGDGSCLFHSLSFGLRALGDKESAYSLRSKLADYIRRNPKLEIAGDTLEEWVSWDSNSSVHAYSARMAQGRAWGGGIEIAACALLKRSNIHVYERKGGELRRISCFDCPEKTRGLVHILYQGGMHYDALQVPQSALR